ncbi:MAG TPA: hypothetical protein VET48_01245, partial [Steroidobacteraceae bacterium]|nr:hypothetical protein [Steroidobacteraceae bacterium]
MMDGLSKTLHYESRSIVSATAEQVFAFLDDHRNLSQHMSESSWMMAGSKMTIEVDALQGRAEGSHIRLSGL